jgi:hypothetical protein
LEERQLKSIIGKIKVSPLAVISFGTRFHIVTTKVCGKNARISKAKN